MTDRKRAETSRDAAHFEKLYNWKPDPWDLATSPYERQKYEATLAALGGRRFASGVELGCSIGVLTERLGALCDRLLGIDIIPSALDAARARCAGQPHIGFRNIKIPDGWPDQRTFDLIVLSEVLYFLTVPDIGRVAGHVARSALPGAILLLVNFTGPTDDPCSGDEAAEAFINAATGFTLLRQERADRFRLDMLERAGGG